MTLQLQAIDQDEHESGGYIEQHQETSVHTADNNNANGDDATSLLTIRQVQTSQELQQCQAMRLQVFVNEQRIPRDVEMDGQDDSPHAIHLIGFYDKQPVATGRLLLASPNEAVMGRIVVLSSHRGRGWGSRMVQQLEQIAKSNAVQRISLTPHHYLQHFYERMGFQQVPGTERDSVIWVNEHCQLIAMEKYLN